MRFSFVVVATFALTSTSLGAPLKRNFLSSIGGAISNLKNANATLSGIVGTVVQSVENPQLTAARLEVLKSLSAAGSTLSQIDTQAKATGNSGVSTLVAAAQTGVSSAQKGIDNIGAALVSGNKPSTADQKNVAVGIKGARDAVNQMPAAITTPDATLSSNIASAQGAVQGLQTGGQDVLSASGLSLTDLGLPANFATS